MLDISRAIQRASKFFSFIIGLGVSALLFHRAYGVKRTLALPAHELQDKIVNADGKCYRYRVEDATCQMSTKL